MSDHGSTDVGEKTPLRTYIIRAGGNPIFLDTAKMWKNLETESPSPQRLHGIHSKMERKLFEGGRKLFEGKRDILDIVQRRMPDQRPKRPEIDASRAL